MRVNVFVVLLGVVAACALSGARETGPQETSDTEHARYKRLVGVAETFVGTIGKLLFDSANTVDSIGLRNSGPLQPAPYGGPGGLQVPPGY